MYQTLQHGAYVLCSFLQFFNMITLCAHFLVYMLDNFMTIHGCAVCVRQVKLFDNAIFLYSIPVVP